MLSFPCLGVFREFLAGLMHAGIRTVIRLREPCCGSTHSVMPASHLGAGLLQENELQSFLSQCTGGKEDP